MRRLVVAACVSLAVVGLFANFTSAGFTAATAVPGNSIGVDALAYHFSGTPGTAVQAGTSTPVASGDIDTLRLDFATVPSARTFTDVFRVTNVTGSAQSATLTLAGVSQVSAAVFATSGTGSVTLGPGASTAVSVTTSNTVAGRGAGTLRLGLAGYGWLYRDYPLTLDEAPEAPGALTATPRPAGRIDLSWPASSTTMNLAGYDVWRSTGGPYTKVNGTLLTGLTYSDTATVDGTLYTYVVRAVSTPTPVLDSLDSPTANARADATPPGQPTAIVLSNGGGNGNAYINLANGGALAVSITLPAGSLATDTVELTLSNGANSVTVTSPASAGAGTITITGINVGTLGDGTVTASAISTDLAGNVSTARTASFPKDTVAPGVPSANYTDRNSPQADRLTGTAEANSTVRANRTLPTAAGPYTTTANGTGAYTLNVANSRNTSVTYTVTATDAAGNTSATGTYTFNDTR